jgi:hypothetical protein
MTASSEKGTSQFRQYLPDLATGRFTKAKDQDIYEYTQFFRETKTPPWLHNLTQIWEVLYREPFHGVTTDGNVIPDLFKVEDEELDIESIVQATDSLLDRLTSAEREKIQYPLDSREWRAWSNPEFLLRPLGLRLEEVQEGVALSILKVVQATLSPEGYNKAISAMRINHFLGELCQLPRILNKYSYNFLLFGTPSATEQWGWSLYGHHLCINVFLMGRQIVMSPIFTGAEPNIIDEGKFAGTKILHTEGTLGLHLMQSLNQEQQEIAQIFKNMYDPVMNPTGDLAVDRWNKDDQRMQCCAFRDNRVLPYEGVRVTDTTLVVQELLLDVVEQFLLYLPAKSRQMRKEQIRTHFDDTFISWIGGFTDEDPFYYRIQSPVILLEFDHHSGVFLTNDEPMKFHTHTIVRMPNGGDYGFVYRQGRDMI